jgi:exonuclease III
MDIKNTFKITMINIQELNNSMKQEQIINYMEINKIDILCVNETKLKQKIAKVIYKNNHNILS